MNSKQWGRQFHYLSQFMVIHENLHSEEPRHLKISKIDINEHRNNKNKINYPFI